MRPRPPRPLAPGAKTHEWGNFLGPRHNGELSETPLAKAFGPTGPRRLWEMPKGEGYAPVAVHSGRAFVFHRIAGRETLTAVDATTGKVLWNQSHPVSYSDRYGYDGGPRCQPVVDAKQVVTLGVGGALTAWEPATGKGLWRRDLIGENKGGTGFFGVGATPLLQNGRVIVVSDTPNGGLVLCLDAGTGRTRWQTPVPWGPGYTAPVPATVHGRPMVFLFLGSDDRPPTGGLVVIDHESGKILSTFAWRARRYESVNAATPRVDGNRVLISECYGAGTALLDIAPDGSLKPVWTNRDVGSHFMTPALRDNHYYLVDGHGPYNCPLVCLDARTGTLRWREEPEWNLSVRISGRMETVRRMPARASLLPVADGRCLVLGEYGHLAWIDLSPQGYRERERVQLFAADNSWSPPSLSHGLLYVNQNTPGYDDTPARVHCVDLRGAA